MALTTRGVLAIIAGLLMVGALLVARSDRRLLATWVMMVGFVTATLYSVMSIFWAQSNPSPLTPEVWMTMASMAAAMVIYFGYMGLLGEGIGE
jgi:peptidoglycan/LPS O-acetylase OafA/YrhL